ncbi:MAG TPA: hypothetical protein VFN57_18165 [Thermomicrobiaceae bacterium]|nr:hypothetical protein [Thermomicrobiaceae bacterium]
MSGELRIVTEDGEDVWFGRDEHFPNEVRQDTGDPHHWDYLLTTRARALVDPVLFFENEPHTPAG